ncbi:S8 family serine peptidase [Kamptonema sp. UHCC 0994]|uniref:S8 family serine peptidase n=1 Tax=Kamptonema sp. UHCC 0994 TaxID=3031329 RepID=UPI0023B8F8C1|nr:S8 family serine peptidase [Kamptonema sp. UHCC 0994]MDF0553691.1 S8 family serine peptidase [Kamptonema sp. UHCC 0994]
MAGPSTDNLAYLLDESPNSLTLTPGFLTPYPKGLFALGGNDFILGSSDSEMIDGGDNNDRLIGGGGADTLNSGSGDNFLIGSQGDDILAGNSGKDILRGGQGDDLLIGFEGDDVLVGDKGKDILKGGEGSDLFVLTTETAAPNPESADIITDFKHFFWKNLIGLTGGLTVADITLESASLNPGSNDTLIRIRDSGAVLGWVADVSPDYLNGRFVAADTKLGDELGSATNLGSLSDNPTLSGFVGDAKPDDFYRFTLSVTSDLKLNVSGLSADLDVALIKDINNNNAVEPPDIVQVSENSDANSEEINLNDLLPGTYFVRVFRFEEAQTNYTMSLSAIPSPPPPPGSSAIAGYDTTFGYGLINAAAAVAQSIGKAPFPDVPNLGGDEWGRDLVNAPEVWAQGLTGDGIVVAVVDSGVDYDHPDLTGNIWTNSGEFGLDANGVEKATNGLDDDGNGFVDDFRGWDFVNSDNNPMDENSHGTHVAGIIAAKKDGVGITGVAPTVKIMPVRTVDKDGVGKVSNGIAGIRYAVDNGADVINLSFGGNDMEAERLDAIRYAESKGVVVVSAAGNSSNGRPNLPARLADEVGIAVGSITRDVQFSEFSNRAGVVAIDYVIAPGGDGGRSDVGDVYSTVPLSLPGIPYRYFFGTSMAAPHVAGVVALIRQANPNLTPKEIEKIVVETATRSGIIV